MGVTGLWSAIKPAMDASTNLLQISTQAFDSTPNLRGLRVGIDASSWTYAQEMKERSLGGASIVGPNLALRNLFFKCCLLQKSGLLPLFIFDGPDRPKKIKRSGGYRISRVGLLFQELLELMGIEFRTAPGEAEAELAALSDRDIIDAILTDDVDTLVFAKSATLIRNWSATLSGNQGKGAGNTSNPPPSSQSNSFPSTSQYSQASTSQIPSSPIKSQSQSQHQSQSQSQSTTTKTNPTTDLAIYRSSTIFEIVGLDNHGMILMAVLLGGDYDPVGFLDLGEKTALGLAKGGFGTSLFEGTRRYGHSKSKLEQFLDIWRGEVADELASNSKKLIGSKKLVLSKAFRETKDFPRIEIINAYISPNISREELWEPLDWNKMVDLDGLVRFVREYFEWRDGDILMRLRNRFFMAVLIRGIRQELLEEDKSTNNRSSSSNNREVYHPPSSPSSFLISAPTPSQLFNKITRTNTAQSTSFIDSYRLVLSEREFLKILDPIIADLPPIINPVQRYNDVGEIVIPRDEKARDGETKDLSHWVPKSFMVGRSARAIVEEYEDVLWEKDNALREKEEIKNRKAMEREEKLRMKIAKAASNSSPRKRSHSEAGSSQTVRGVNKADAVGKKNFKKKLLNDIDSDSDDDVAITSAPLDSHFNSSGSPTSSSTSTGLIDYPSTRPSIATSKPLPRLKKAKISSSAASTSSATIHKKLQKSRSMSPMFTSSDDDLSTKHINKSPRKKNKLTASSHEKEVIYISSEDDDDENDNTIRIRSRASSRKSSPREVRKLKLSIEKGKGKEKEKNFEEKGKGKGKGKEVVVFIDLTLSDSE